MIALVLSVIFSSIFLGSMLKVCGSMSTNTGIALWCKTAVAEARKVSAGTITSSPGSITIPAIHACREAVPLFKARQNLEPVYFAYSF